MSQKTQMIVFGVLLGILALVVYSNLDSATGIAAPLFSGAAYKPLGIPDPALRFDLLKEIQKQDYAPRRNIFVASLPPPPEDRKTVQNPDPLPPPPPPPPPAEVFPFKFYGFKEDPRTGQRRGFFTDGENVWILNVGETLQSRWKLLRIGNDSAEVESLATGKRLTAQLELPPTP